MNIDHPAVFGLGLALSASIGAFWVYMIERLLKPRSCVKCKLFKNRSIEDQVRAWHVAMNAPIGGPIGSVASAIASIRSARPGETIRFTGHQPKPKGHVKSNLFDPQRLLYLCANCFKVCTAEEIANGEECVSMLDQALFKRSDQFNGLTWNSQKPNAQVVGVTSVSTLPKQRERPKSPPFKHTRSNLWDNQTDLVLCASCLKVISLEESEMGTCSAYTDMLYFGYGTEFRFKHIDVDKALGRTMPKAPDPVVKPQRCKWFD